MFNLDVFSLRKMNSAVLFSSIPITDWIQAIGIIIGFPAALWGIIKLFKKDKDRQKEISSLTSLAESQAKMIEKISEQIEIDRRTHLNSILPFFNEIKPFVHNNNTFRLELTNTGKRCKFKEYQWDYSSNVEIDSISDIYIFVETNESIIIKGYTVDNSSFFENGFFSIWISFEDIEENQYQQKIIKGAYRFYIDRPVLYYGSLSTSVQKTIRDVSSQYIH
jgi:hypothetical protein